MHSINAPGAHFDGQCGLIFRYFGCSFAICLSGMPDHRVGKTLSDNLLVSVILSQLNICVILQKWQA
jgi:hypothetical protein